MRAEQDENTCRLDFTESEKVALGKLSRIRAALEAAKSLDDVVNIRDQATAVATYAKAIGLGIENVNAAVDVKLSAERKAGKLLAAMGLKAGKPANGNTTLPLSDLGISKMQSHRWQTEAANQAKTKC